MPEASGCPPRAGKVERGTLRDKPGTGRVDICANDIQQDSIYLCQPKYTLINLPYLAHWQPLPMFCRAHFIIVMNALAWLR